MKDITQCGASQREPFTKYYYDNRIKMEEMGGTCDMRWSDEKL
jgi:hypothetical protein